jgi:hypothetical protein
MVAQVAAAVRPAVQLPEMGVREHLDKETMAVLRWLAP